MPNDPTEQIQREMHAIYTSKLSAAVEEAFKEINARYSVAEDTDAGLVLRALKFGVLHGKLCTMIGGMERHIVNNETHREELRTQREEWINAAFAAAVPTKA